MVRGRKHHPRGFTIIEILIALGAFQFSFADMHDPDDPSDKWVCDPVTSLRSVSFTFAGRPDHYKVWDCTCPGDSSKNRTGGGASLALLNGLPGCLSNSPPRRTLWNPSSPPAGPGSLLCGSSSMCSGSTPDPINNPTDQCYAWGFQTDGTYSTCARNMSCTQYQLDMALHLDFSTGESGTRACAAIPTPLLSPKITLSNYTTPRNYTLGVYGNDFVLGEGGGVDGSGNPIPFNMKLTMKPDGKLITKDLNTGSIKTDGPVTVTGGDLTMGSEKNLYMNGGDIILGAGATIQNFSPPAPRMYWRHWDHANHNSGAGTDHGERISGVTGCAGFIQKIYTMGEELNIAECQGRMSGTNFIPNAVCDATGGKEINCWYICW